MIEDLSQLRESIDVLDDEILKALAQRMKLSDQVLAAKNGVAAFRPGREAALVRQLVAKGKADGLDIGPEVILCVWRQIMAASLSRQDGELVCGVHHDAMPAAAWHMGSALLAFVDLHDEKSEEKSKQLKLNRRASEAAVKIKLAFDALNTMGTLSIFS